MSSLDPSLIRPPQSHEPVDRAGLHAPEALPYSGDFYSVIDRSSESIQVEISDFVPDGLDLHALEGMQEAMPLTHELYGVSSGKYKKTITLPTPDALNSFKERHLQELGATNMQVKLVEGGVFSPEQLVDSFSEGTIPIATEAKYFFHDISEHAVGAITLAEEQTRVFQKVAQLCQSLRATDPEAAQDLAVSLASVFDRQTSVRARFQKALRFSKEEPLLLSGLAGNLKHGSSRVLEAVEAIIDDVPADSPVAAGATKLDRWTSWEAEHMPDYGAKIVRKLSEQPPHQKRLNKTAAAVRRALRLAR